MNEKKLTNKDGFSLMEVIIATAIVSMALVGISSLTVQNIKVQSVNKNKMIASMLAQEALELVRNVRDDNWLDESKPDWFGGVYEDNAFDLFLIEPEKTFIIHAVNNLSPDPWIIDYLPDDLNSVRTELYLNPLGFYTHIPVPNPADDKTLFKRLVKTQIYDLNLDTIADAMYVEVEVRWMERGIPYNYIAETYLYNWR